MERSKSTRRIVRWSFIWLKSRTNMPIETMVTKTDSRILYKCYSEKKYDSPKTGARMYDPVTRSLLPDSFFHKGLLAAEQLHRKLVVRRLKKGLQLIPEEALFDLLARWSWTQLLLRGTIQGHIVHPEVDLTASFVIHLVAWKQIWTKLSKWERELNIFGLTCSSCGSNSRLWGLPT